MSNRSIIDVLEGHSYTLPEGLEPAIKFLNPDWTTYGGFSWWQPGRRWITDHEPFNPAVCEPGGLHVANTIKAAQSGGHSAAYCLLVGIEPASSEWEDGKRKAQRVWVAGPVDLIEAIRHNGHNANMEGAMLGGANLGGANLWGANLEGANLKGADLTGANLERANLRGANLEGADLWSADLGGANLTVANLTVANLRGANLRSADLGSADLTGAHLKGANLRDANFWDANMEGVVS